MDVNIIVEFESALQQLIGQSCWSVQAGAIGSLASLHFGEKVPLDKPLPFPNKQLTPEEHKLRGEYVLYVEDCPWRIEDDQQVLATWLDSNAPRGPIVTYMRGFIGQQVQQVTLTRPGMDLAILFDSGTILRIFPDQTNPDEGDNYSLSFRNKTYIVAAGSKVYIE